MFCHTFLALFFCAGALVADDVLVLTVERAVERALMANRQVIGAQEALTRSELQQGLQEGVFDLQWAPHSQTAMDDRGATVGAGFNLKQKLPWGTALGCAPTVARGRGFYTGGVTFSLSQPLFRGRARELNERKLRAAEFGVRSSERALRLAEVGVVLRTVRALYNVGKREAIVELEAASCERLSRFLKATRLKGRVGVASDMDLYRAEIEWRTGVGALDAAREALEGAREELRQLLSLPAGIEMCVEAPLSDEPLEIGHDVLLERALANRLELLQAFEQIEENRRQARTAKHQLLPDLNLSCTYGRQAVGGEWRQDWAVGLTTGTNWSRAAEETAYTMSLMSVRAAERALDGCREQVRRDVKRTARGLTHSHARIEVGREKLKNAEGKLRLARLRLRRGLATSFDLLQSEKGFTGAQRDLLNALVDHTLGFHQLLAAQGVLL